MSQGLPVFISIPQKSSLYMIFIRCLLATNPLSPAFGAGVAIILWGELVNACHDTRGEHRGVCYFTTAKDICLSVCLSVCLFPSLLFVVFSTKYCSHGINFDSESVFAPQ